MEICIEPLTTHAREAFLRNSLKSWFLTKFTTRPCIFAELTFCIALTVSNQLNPF